MTEDPGKVARRPKVLVPIVHPVGGIQTWCKYFYRHPSFRQYDLEIIAPMSEECLQLQQAMQPLGIPVTVTPSSLQQFALRTWRAIASRKWDLVHAQGFTSAAVCTPVSRLFRVPCLVTQHDVVLPEHYTDRKGKLIRTVTRSALALATRIHSVSESAAANLRGLVRNRKATCDRITVILNGIDSKLFYEAPGAELRAELGLRPDDFLVGFFGRFMKQKGFSTLFDAVHQLLQKSPSPPRRIIVVAVGSGAYRAREERKIAAMGLQEHFRFVGFYPVVASLIKAMDVVAIPSLWEACPLLPMEALVCGTPVISSDYDALVEVTARSPATIFPINDSQALATRLEEHMATDHRCAAREFAPIALTRYSADPRASEIAALYQELIGRGN